jgi:FKBP-type peptidyl-prolyl cis-trans isomerase FklB
MVARWAGSSLVYAALLFGLFAVSSAATTAEGIAHLEKNAKAPGVTVLPSGLQYRVIRPSPTPDGPTPAVNSPCVCHYHGSLIDGTVFDSSVKRGSPITFAPNQVVKGWTEALQLMHEGDKWELTVPSDLAYGARGSPPKIPGGSVLVFELELITVKGASKYSFFGVDFANPQLLFAAAMLVFYGYKTFGAGGGGAKGPKISLEEAMKSPENPTVYFDMQIGEEDAGRIEMILFKEHFPKTVDSQPRTLKPKP